MPNPSMIYWGKDVVPEQLSEPPSSSCFQGIYEIDVEDEETCAVRVTTQRTSGIFYLTGFRLLSNPKHRILLFPADSIYHPLIAALFIQLFLDFLRRLIIVLYKKRLSRNSMTDAEETEASSQVTPNRYTQI